MNFKRLNDTSHERPDTNENIFRNLHLIHRPTSSSHVVSLGHYSTIYDDTNKRRHTCDGTSQIDRISYLLYEQNWHVKC